jgi:hypothetical protein
MKTPRCAIQIGRLRYARTRANMKLRKLRGARLDLEGTHLQQGKNLFPKRPKGAAHLKSAEGLSHFCAETIALRRSAPFRRSD